MQTVTIDHDRIKAWAEQRQGRPALIDDPMSGLDKVGLRINFPGDADEAMLSDRPITQDTDWETFFRYFEDQKLAFIMIDPPNGPNDSWAYKFIPREALGDLKRKSE